MFSSATWGEVLCVCITGHVRGEPQLLLQQLQSHRWSQEKERETMKDACIMIRGLSLSSLTNESWLVKSVGRFIGVKSGVGEAGVNGLYMWSNSFCCFTEFSLNFTMNEIRFGSQQTHIWGTFLIKVAVIICVCKPVLKIIVFYSMHIELGSLLAFM